MAGLPGCEKKIEDTFIRYDRIHERDRQADRQTDTQTPHDDTGRACIASRGKHDTHCKAHRQSHNNCCQITSAKYIRINAIAHLLTLFTPVTGISHLSYAILKTTSKHSAWSESRGQKE